ncbi:MAG: peptide chain release factor H [Snowella sp.]|nr:peptide chain release factor H [Snowella sp.]
MSQCWLQITSGRGPDECAYFVGKLLPIILDDAKDNHLSCDLIEAIPGNQPDCYLSIIISLKGENYLEFIQCWQGTIQWIEKSPFRSHHKRKNWFIGVSALTVPETSDSLLENELKFQTMRSSGPGGQNVNKTETAVRVIHLPTGISVVAQEERSQYLNKKLALAKLLALLESNKNNMLQQLDYQLWHQHNQLERGNLIRIFKPRKNPKA